VTHFVPDTVLGRCWRTKCISVQCFSCF